MSMLLSQTPVLACRLRRDTHIHASASWGLRSAGHRPPAAAIASPHQAATAVCFSSQRASIRLSAAAADNLHPPDGAPHVSTVLHSVQQFVAAQYLPVALLSALLLGAIDPAPGLAAAKLQIPALATFGIFIVQGLQLRKKEAMSAMSMKGEIAFGLASILVLTPLLGILVAQLPLSPRPLALGLGLVCTVPTALACGVAFVQQLGGNVSLALLLTVTSNVIGICTMPFFLPHVVSAASLHGGASAATAGVTVDPVPLMTQLCRTILLPTFLGASIRGFVPGASVFIDKHKKTLAYINAGLLASVPWMQISKTASQRMAVDLMGLLATAAAAVGVLFLFMLMNSAGCRLLRIGGPDPSAAKAVRRSLIVVTSVKTLPVAVTVLTKLGPVLGESVVGIAMLPVVFYQLAQIICGAVIVSQWLAADNASALKDS